MIANLTGENSSLSHDLQQAKDDIQSLKQNLDTTERRLQDTEAELAQSQRQARKDADDAHDKEMALEGKLAVAQDTSAVLSREKASLQQELQEAIKHDKEGMAANKRLQSSLDEEHTKRIQE